MNGKDYAAVNAQRRAPSQHRIAEVDYSEDRLVCGCGAVMRAQGAKEYPAHRVAVGERPLSLSTAYGSGRR